jgi:hypothetical protein
VKESLLINREQIQCIVGHDTDLCTVGFGESQKPGLMDYADAVDTVSFLLGIMN